MREIVLTVLIAFLGGYLGIRLKIPAGALIGAMAAVAILNIATGRADFPAETSRTDRLNSLQPYSEILGSRMLLQT